MEIVKKVDDCIYSLYQPSDGSMNNSCEDVEFNYITTVSPIEIEGEIHGLNDAYRLFNKIDPYYQPEIRSASVGDVLVNEITNRHYMVMPMGFEEIQPFPELEPNDNFEE